MNDRWADEAERALVVKAWLADVEAARLRLEAAEDRAAGDLEPWLQRREHERAAGARKGLDAAIGMAMSAPAGVTDEQIAEAAGVGVSHVEVVRARLQVQ